jgi:sugar phosphate isomerase/epimerase
VVALVRASNKAGMYVEGILRPPGKGKAELGRFESDLQAARLGGASVVRMAMLSGRRYETFKKAEDYATFARGAEESLKRAEPIARKHGVKLAVENHKDFRVDEMVAMLKKISSEYVGVCLDTGNNLALLEEPMTTVEALAPFTLTVHLKDMGTEEAPDGFRIAEVPLGQGFLDLKAIVAAIRKRSPKARFNLEMITRDPLLVPCLSDKYWATLGRVPGRDLARMLALVRRTVRKEPLPKVSTLPKKKQLEVEDANVKASFAHALKVGLIPEVR